MRKLVVGEFVTVDGVMEGPGPGDDFEQAGWTMPYFTDEIGQILGGNMAESDAMLLGRKTYQVFAASFSAQTGGMADFLNNVPKYVVSKTLKTADWNNSTLIKGDIAEAITKLKQLPGKDIFINGSCTLIQTLRKHNLIDEYSLLVYPVALGTGKRLFGEGSKECLKLIQSKALSSGVVHLTYRTERQS
jgi:dihydrofolate reductase